jgi:hypothetical protein
MAKARKTINKAMPTKLTPSILMRSNVERWIDESIVSTFQDEPLRQQALLSASSQDKLNALIRVLSSLRCTISKPTR